MENEDLIMLQDAENEAIEEMKRLEDQLKEAQDRVARLKAERKAKEKIVRKKTDTHIQISKKTKESESKKTLTAKRLQQAKSMLSNVQEVFKAVNQ